MEGFLDSSAPEVDMQITRGMQDGLLCLGVCCLFLVDPALVFHTSCLSIVIPGRIYSDVCRVVDEELSGFRPRMFYSYGAQFKAFLLCLYCSKPSQTSKKISIFLIMLLHH